MSERHVVAEAKDGAALNPEWTYLSGKMDPTNHMFRYWEPGWKTGGGRPWERGGKEGGGGSGCFDVTRNGNISTATIHVFSLYETSFFEALHRVRGIGV